MTAGPCLGDVAAALVDGELDHAARERAQRHLAHCATCRAEVETQRRLKTRLSGLTGEPAPAVTGLTARLLQVASLDVPAEEPAARRSVRAASRARRPGLAAATSERPGSAARPGATGPAGRTRRGPSGRPHRAQRRALAGTTVVAVGFVAAFALGAPQQQRPTTPLDPGADTFVAEFVSTTTDQFPAGPAVPTSGGVGSPR